MANLPQPYNKQSREFAEDLEVINPEQRNSVINLVSSALQCRIDEAIAAKPELFQMEEVDLARAISPRPSKTDNRIRMKFWDEYDRVHSHATDGRNVGDRVPSMNMTAIYSGICMKEYFYNVYLHKPEKVAWMLCMPSSYTVKMEELLAFGTEQLRDVLELPHCEVDKKGVVDLKSINTKLIEIKAKIVAMVDQRVKGQVIQTIHQKNMNLNVSATAADVKNAGMALTMADMDKRLAELDRRDKLKERPQNGDVEVEVVKEN